MLKCNVLKCTSWIMNFLNIKWFNYETNILNVNILNIRFYNIKVKWKNPSNESFSIGSCN
jgi:hypothetical protein